MTGFTDQEKVKIRHHLGYLNVAASATFVLGSPAAVETQFIIESAMNLVLVAAEPEVRRQLTILDCIEEQMNCDRELLAVNEVGEIKIRGTEMKELRKYLLEEDQIDIPAFLRNPMQKRQRESLSRTQSNEPRMGAAAKFKSPTR